MKILTINIFEAVTSNLPAHSDAWSYHVPTLLITINNLPVCRLAAMLRQLAQYHMKDGNNQFMVRLAQGLTHLGKGTMSLSPYHSNRQLMSPVAVAGLLATCMAFLDCKTRELLLLLSLNEMPTIISNNIECKSWMWMGVIAWSVLSLYPHLRDLALFKFLIAFDAQKGLLLNLRYK